MLPAKQPLEKTPATSSLQERIRQSLEDELRSGAMQPGDAIDEPALCERFGGPPAPRGGGGGGGVTYPYRNLCFW